LLGVDRREPQGWQNPLEVLEQLLSGLVDGDSDVDPRALESLAGVIDVGQPALLLGALATASIEGLPGGVVSGLPAPAPEPLGPGNFDGLLPDDGAAEIVGALAAISIGFGEARVTFIQQVGMAPVVVIELSQQVLAGTIEPDDALRRLVVAPLRALLTGHPELTGNPAIDAVFTNGVRQPVFDAFVNNLPAPGGLVDRVTETINDFGNTIYEPHRRRWAEARSGRRVVRRQRRGVYRQGRVVCRRHRVVSGQRRVVSWQLRRRPTREREAGKPGLLDIAARFAAKGYIGRADLP
jgi:hypothetical protein